ncbi:probable folate-biopterin transporter 3 isoform X1 [Cynara cardunculus var. scolymus]|uniref:Biopterin transport-related protein BT1 n=2 Tax=Cynara cardunculus var. scolymus TaxID=59895 RepID=A0A103YBL5_CYNCS|nr:probable folate-biopterin transporter 3 isoform X1 [Cynara cardunculus var. scolymus]KVI06095.1 Biopterin transport-related protein BT1 [Cynara cardunculus var. scolymus]
MDEEVVKIGAREEDNFVRRKEGANGNLIWRPVNWFRMLSDELSWRFVLAVVIVYGINQGTSIGLYRVSVQYYMKDVQKLQPSEAQFYSGIIQIPWIIKPLWGLMTDIVPIFRLRRRPYFIFAGLVGSISMLVPAFSTDLSLVWAILSFMTASAGVAIADVTIDACVTENSISHPSLAGDLQSLCAISTSIGQLVGFAMSGVLVHIIGPKGVFGILSIPAGMVILVGMMLQEPLVHSYSHKRVSQKFLDATKTMVTALKCPDVWRPCLYMYLSLAFGLNIHEGMFYWYTDAKAGPSFSQEVIGSIFSVGAIGSLLGVLLYQNVFRNHPFRHVLFWTQLLFGASSLLDLVLVLRLNLQFGVPDYIFVVMDEAVSKMIARLKWMPLLVLSSKLCPSGIEGTFFALLMSIDHVGLLSSSWAGGLLLHALNVTRTQFDNLWTVVLIRSFARLCPIGLLFLVPRNDPDSSILPSELLLTKKGDDVLESEDSEMISLVNNHV